MQMNFPYQQPWQQQLGWYLEHQTGSKYLYIHQHWNKKSNLHHPPWTYPYCIQCSKNPLSNFLAQIVTKEKVTEIFFLFRKILQYCKYYFHLLNGNNTGFHLQISMLGCCIYSHHYLVWEWKGQWVPLWLR